MDFTIRIANRHILIHSIYPSVYNLCRPYWAERSDEPDIVINIDENMISAEAELFRRMKGPVLSIKNVEKLLVHRMITEELLLFDTILMHGASLALEDTAFVFTAKSGTGKTTHIQRWLENIAGAYTVNGDKPFIIVGHDPGKSYVCGSPWAGKENLNTNTVIPLRSIVLLERGNNNYMERISFSEAFPFVLEQVYLPNDKDKMRITLHLLQRLSRTVSFWRFKCNNFKDDCFEVAYNALVREQK